MYKHPEDMSEISDCIGKLVKSRNFSLLRRLQEIVDEHIKIINRTQFHCCTIVKGEMGPHSLFSTTVDSAGCHRAICL